MGRNWSRDTSTDGQIEELRRAHEQLERRVALIDDPESVAAEEVGDVPFGSATAARVAVDAELDAEDFEGMTPEGETGFLTSQVRELIAEEGGGES